MKKKNKIDHRNGWVDRNPFRKRVPKWTMVRKGMNIRATSLVSESNENFDCIKRNQWMSDDVLRQRCMTYVVGFLLIVVLDSIFEKKISDGPFLVVFLIEEYGQYCTKRLQGNLISKISPLP